MAKKRKKNYKLRKSVRRTLGALFMISAIVIAAIPFPDAAATDVLPVSGGEEEREIVELPTPNYVPSIDNDINESVTLNNPNSSGNPNPNPGASTFGTTGYENITKRAYTLLQIDGKWYYEWQFEFYPLTGTNNAIINHYNKSYSTPNVELKQTINTGYMFVEKTEIDKYFSEGNDGAREFSITVDNYNVNNVNDVESYIINKYFASSCATMKEQVDKFNAGTLGGGITDITDIPDIKVKPSSLSESKRLEYYCEMEFDNTSTDSSLVGGSLYQSGYTLQMAYADGTISKQDEGPNAVSKPFYEIYIPKKLDSSVSTPGKYSEDVNGFLYKADTSYMLVGIGDNAFYDVDNVESIVMSSQIAYIGNSAFEKASMVTTIKLGNTREIGNYAFKSCERLMNVELLNGLNNIGTEAFAETSLNNISFPGTINKIGYGAFANCRNLSGISFDTNSSAVEISDYAFYNCPSLASQNFEQYSIAKIGEGAFALTVLDNGTCTEFVFPRNLLVRNKVAGYDAEKPSWEEFGDCILAGRTGLKNVTMPAAMGSEPTTIVKVPIGTFQKCSQLSSVVFPETCVNVEYADCIFSNVDAPGFYVQGPALLSSGKKDPSLPRKATWDCKISNGDEVPYKYTLNGQDYYELKSDDTYLLSLVITGSNTAIVGQCTLVPGASSTGGKLEIKDEIGGYKIVELGDGCITEEVKGNEKDSSSGIKELIIGNNVTKIGDSVFEKSQNLETVTLGNGVTTIGNRAFASCPKLESINIGAGVTSIGEAAFKGCKGLKVVKFEEPASASAFPKENIGAEAFTINETDSADAELTFIGLIDPEYGPFAWAMNPENFVNKSMGTRVCYRSGDPANLTVILDNMNNYPTLVDYLHYSDLADIPAVNSDGSGTTLKAKYEDPNERVNLNALESSIINSIFNLNIPAGIESIDVRGFIKDRSLKTDDAAYAYLGNSVNVAKYLATKNNSRSTYTNYLEKTLAEGLSTAKYDSYATYGLFNGSYEATANIIDKYGNPISNDSIGNDALETVTMSTVKYLPYNEEKIDGDILAQNDLAGGAFYDCDNLQTVDLGAELEDIGLNTVVTNGKTEDLGRLPFLGCHNLNNVISGSKNAAGSPKYECEQKIIYENLDDGTRKIVECLNSRGYSQDGKLNVESDSYLVDVSSIAAGAFSDCTELRRVDLRGNTKLTKLPDKAFFNASNLSTLDLPENIKVIGQKAFANITNSTPALTIYGKEVSIATTAFDDSNVLVYTYKNTAAYNTAEGILGSDNVEAIPEGYRVQFFDYDGVTPLSDIQYIEEGKNAIPPKDPTRVGYIFKNWNKSYENVTSDLEIIALYDIDPENPGGLGTGGNGGTGNGDGTGNGNGTGNGGNGSTGGTSVNGGIDTDGDGVPDVDANGNKLYKLTVTNGEGSGYYPAGKTVSIKAGNAPGGTTFAYWSCSNEDLIFDDRTDWITTLTMISSDVTVICNFTGQYTLEVEYGSGSGSYPAGAKVAISAVEAPQGRKFASWVTKTSGLNIENSRKESTIITMPASNAKITATYMDTGSISGNSTPSKNNTSIVITKPGISDKNTASAYVSGSTDNFIVKISESLEAADEVQKALQKKYSDMSRIKYFAMDISLYDAKGVNKITDTTGLKVNITIPIPDALREYAGNNRVGAVVNGNLETLNPKFTTINGVPSVTFTATHFSPYTIYVDTGNMTVSSVPDSTPKTGDGIHPKWFLSIGLACISIILFTKKDRRYTAKAYR